MENHMEGIKPGKLFAGSCIALVATAMTFAVIGAIMGPLKEQFILSNREVGFIGGAALWGFPLSILIFGPLCSVLGMRFLLRLAFVFFVVGVFVMIFASGFWMLFFGALIIAFANGLVEGACNPLVATLYPDRKVEKLNQFHVWFPGGIVIGGLMCFFLGLSGVSFGKWKLWQVEIGMILLPAIVYAFVMLGEKFPPTERAQKGVSFVGMMKATLLRPLFLLLFFCMMLTASIELGPNRWVTAVIDSMGSVAGTIPVGILVLVWTSLLMAILRQFSGPVVAKLSPTGMLLGSAVLSGIGLFALSYADTFWTVLIADTVFAVGICYFWPTMLGVASERVPKGGEMALALLGAAGNIVVGVITIPLMGYIADFYGHDRFQVAETVPVIERIAAELPQVAQNIKDQKMQESVKETVTLAGAVLAEVKATNQLPRIKTANVLRGTIKAAPDSELGKLAQHTLNPAELHGGRVSFRYVSGLAIILVIIFGAIYARDRAMGGYKAEQITA